MMPWMTGNAAGLYPAGSAPQGMADPNLYDPGYVDELNKALMAGSDIDNPGTSAGEGFPLRMESLDSTLFNVTYAAKDIRFWRELYKDKAYNTVEEYNRLEEYGSGNAIWMAEGDLPNEDDSTYSRQYTKIKFMGTVRRVSHVVTVIKGAHGDPVARETVNGTLFLLRQVERALFDADSNMNELQFDGLERLLVEAWGATAEDDGHLSGYTDEHCLDLRAASLTEDHITDLAEIIVREPNYGAPNSLWTTTGPCKDLSKNMYPKERIGLPNGSGVAGVYIETIRTPFGDIVLKPDIFIPDSVKPNASGVGKAAQRPPAPTISSITSPAYAGSDTAAQFAADDAGTYFYKIVAVNKFGKSTPATSSGIAVSAADQVSIGVTDNGSDSLYYEVYRSDLDGASSTCRLIGKIARSAVSQTLVDYNRFLPNTSKAYMLTQTPEVLKWKSLAPFLKLPLAQIDTSIRWMQLLYGALQVMKPKQCGMFINIGKLATGAYA